MPSLSGPLSIPLSRPLVTPLAGGIGTSDPGALSADYIQRVESADGEELESDVKVAITRLFAGMASDPSPKAGVSNLDALKAACLFAGPRTLDGALVPLVESMPAPTNLNFVSGDLTRAGGLKGNGTDKRLLSGRNAEDDPQNNAHLYVRMTDGGGSGVMAAAGGAGGSTVDCTQMVRSDQTVFARVSDGGGSVVTAAIGSGGWGGSRTGSTDLNWLYRDQTGSTSEPSGAVENGQILIFRRTLGNFFDGRLSFYSMGESVDLSHLNSRLEVYETELASALA